ncbi:TolC family protein [Sulfurimonas sp.]|uniref:TolC family protein n=1 Tax=Sulfurimonas sp. TaxID=2022749 RepID=UPI003D149B11
MKRLLVLTLPFLLQAQGLKELLDISEKKNDLLQAKEYQKQAKEQMLSSYESGYFPTVDIGAYYKRQDKPTPFQSGDIYSAFGKLSYNVYDGGKRESNIDMASFELSASKFDKEALKKSLSLNIVQNFYNIQTLQATLLAREEAQKSLQAQLERVKSFYEAKVVTKDDVDRLQSSYDTNIYDMESLKLQIQTLKMSLALQVGQDIDTLEKSEFIKTQASFENLDAIKSLQAQQKALKESADSIESAYYPNITIEDTYNINKYDRKDPVATAMGADPLDNQNTLMVNIGMRLFDFGAIAKTKEAVEKNALALQSQMNYQTKEQKMQLKLANTRIITMHSKIKSAKSALIAAQSAFETIEEKYNAGIVDYVVYLDALTQKTSAKALYESSVNDLEVAYAFYYYYSGKDIKGELQ